jgi:hypothetical protein
LKSAFDPSSSFGSNGSPRARWPRSERLVMGALHFLCRMVPFPLLLWLRSRRDRAEATGIPKYPAQVR